MNSGKKGRLFSTDWWSDYLTEYGYVLLYVFIAVICMNAVIFILHADEFCYEVMPSSNYGTVQVIGWEPTTDCTVITEEEHDNQLSSRSRQEVVGFISFVGWCLTSPRARRTYRKKKRKDSH